MLTNPADATDQYRLHFHGFDIIDAAFDALGTAAIVSDDGLQSMPLLEAATDVIVTGSSAGSFGVERVGDFLADKLGPGVSVSLALHIGLTNTNYFGVATLEDSGGTPRTFHDALVRFLAGNGVVAIDDGVAPASSTCPPTEGAFD